MQSTLDRTVQDNPFVADRVLIDAALAGDESGYVQILQRYQDRLLCSMQSNVGCLVMAEDIVQEAFIMAFVHLPSFRGESNFYTWLFRIALNSRRRYIAKSKTTISLDAINHEQQMVGTEERDSPANIFQGREDRKRVWDAVEKLNAKHRSVLIMREFDGFDYQTISERLQIEMGTVRSRLSRARAELRRELAAYYSGDEKSAPRPAPR